MSTQHCGVPQPAHLRGSRVLPIFLSEVRQGSGIQLVLELVRLCAAACELLSLLLCCRLYHHFQLLLLPFLGLIGTAVVKEVCMELVNTSTVSLASTQPAHDGGALSMGKLDIQAAVKRLPI